jgi:hypothetical protein
MNRAGSDNDDEPIILSVQNALHGLARRRNRARRCCRTGQFSHQLLGTSERPDIADA